MRAMLLRVLGVATLLARAGGDEGTRYAFYREMRASGAPRGGRRLYGGGAARLEEFPRVCALADSSWGARCSCAVLAARWALTAAHCIKPHVAYVQYSTRQPSQGGGGHARAVYLYRHPKYRVVQEDLGRGLDVTVLHHDVGLVRTKEDMPPGVGPLHPDPLSAMRQYNPVDLRLQLVKVIGFGRTEAQAQGEELFSVELQLEYCERGAWFHCVCGAPRVTERGGGGARGVCSGDSGGPVVYNGVQVGVTSLGPVQCGGTAGAGGTSVFTALYHYAELLNSTMSDGDVPMLRMTEIGAARGARGTRGSAVILAGILHVFT